MKYCWVSFYLTEAMGAFTMHYPWWISGVRLEDDASTVVMAIPGMKKQEAFRFIRKAFDKPPRGIEWRFNEIREGSPFSERFPRAKWMKWPETQKENSNG